MFKRLAVLFNFSLAASLALSGCTMDAQLASSLLNSLQNSVTKNTDASTGKTTLTAKDLATAADTAGVKVVCGGKDMTIASADDSSDDSADADTLIEKADTIQPVLFSYGGQDVRRIQINVNLETDLKQLPKLQGQARDQKFKQIQQKYPEMRNARPVPVKGNQGGREIVFAQYETRTVTTTTHATAARPVQAGPGYGAPGFPAGGQQQAGHFQTAPGFPGGPQAGAQPVGHFQPGYPGVPTGTATAAAVKGRPIPGFTNAQGQSCELMAKDDATTTASSDTSSDSSSDSSSDDSSDTSANE